MSRSSTMRGWILCTALLAAPSAALAQSPAPAPSTATAPSSDGAHAAARPAAAGTSATAETHAAPAAATHADDAHGTPAAAPAKKSPRVSRVTLPPPEEAAARAAARAETGYVPIGARPKNAPGARKKPVVSGSVVLASKNHGSGDDGHEVATVGAEAKTPAYVPTVSPSPITGASAPVASNAVADHAGDDGAEPAARKATGPTRLAEVHGRLAAALAEARLGLPASAASGASTARASGADAPAHHPAAKTPRVTLSWPKPRWQVVWPEAPSATPDAAATAAPDPATPRPPRR